MDVKEFSFYTGFLITAITAIVKLFDYLNEVSSLEFSQKVTLWIASIGKKEVVNKSREIIYGMYINFFGSRHFSAKCFSRSVLYSTIILSLFCLGLLVLGRPDMMITVTAKDASMFGMKNLIILDCTFFLSLFSLDYIMLFKTRGLLKRLNVTNKKKFYHVILYLFYDILLSIMILVLFILLFQFIQYMFHLNDYSAVSLDQLRDRLNSPDYNTQFYPSAESYLYKSFALDNDGRLYVISVLLGTLWIITIQLSGFLTKCIVLLSKYLTILRGLVNYKNKPIKSLGAILALSLILVYLLSLPFLFF